MTAYLVTAVFMPSLVNAQFSDEQLIEGIELHRPSRALSADLDNDGDVDVLSYSEVHDKIVWFKNSGDGVFIETILISDEVTNITTARLADFNEDGNLDIVTITYDSLNSKLNFFENQGNGVFTTEIILLNVIDIQAGDIDNDGDVDIVYSFNEDIGWLENLEGDGWANPQGLFSAITPNPKLELTDMDSDEDLDIAMLNMGTNGGSIAYANNQGDGTFSNPISLMDEDECVGVIKLVDINVDGYVDIVYAHCGLHKGLSWRANNGMGGVSGEEILLEDGVFIQDFAFEDIDEDNDLDVFLTFYNTVSWYKNMGNNLFKNQEVLAKTGGSSSVIFDDFDGDEDQDVLYVVRNHNNILWLENQDFTAFEQRIVVKHNTKWITSLLAADIDNDGDLDVLSTSLGNDRIAWHENNGTNFTYRLIAETGASPHDVEVADIDNDGDLDVFSALLGDDMIAWYENLGNGTFGSTQIINDDALQVLSVDATDIDNDGNIDVLSASFGDDILAWYRNDGNGNFSAPQIVDSDFSGGAVLLTADLDNDGDQDIISTAYIGGYDRLTWYENLDNGVFSVPNIIDSYGWSDCVNSVSIVDVNLDEKLDIVLGYKSYDGRNIVWYENLGEGNFSEEYIFNGESSEEEYPVIYSADIDSDGDPDIVETYSGLGSSKVNWYQNYGDGSFSNQQVIDNNAAGARGIYAADINQDGWIDVIQGSWIRGEIVWYQNLGITPTESISDTAPSLKLFPNPASESILFDVENVDDPIYKIELWDMSGHLLREFDWQLQYGKTYVVPLKGMTTGAHVLKFYNESGKLMFVEQFMYFE